jgi:hypothetical protein
VLEDLFVFFAGGKSAIGKLIDKTFGKGSQEKVRKFVKQVVDDLGKLLKKLNEFIPAGDKVKALTAALIGLAAFKAASLVGEFATLATGMGGLGKSAGALALALGGVYAAWDQLNKLDKETEGLGLTGLIAQMAKSGTLDPAVALKEFQDAKARERAGLAPKGLPADAVGAPVQGEGFDPNPGFFKRILGAGSEGAKVAKDFESKGVKRLTFDATAPASAYTTVAPGAVDNSVKTVTAPITITVPPGTPAQTVDRVGKAARQGVRQAVAPLDLSSTLDAVSATGG